jgi:hypothetical protein
MEELISEGRDGDYNMYSFELNGQLATAEE